MKLSDFLFKDMHLKNGEILYLEMDIDLKKKFEEQHWSYKEDMLQIGYRNSYIIDVGWIPEHDEKGSFILTVIKDFNWDEPLVRKKIKDIHDLKKNLEIENSKLEHKLKLSK